MSTNRRSLTVPKYIPVVGYNEPEEGGVVVVMGKVSVNAPTVRDGLVRAAELVTQRIKEAPKRGFLS